MVMYGEPEVSGIGGSVHLTLNEGGTASMLHVNVDIGNNGGGI